MDEREKELIAPFLKKTPEKEAVERMFLDRAKSALEDAGYSAFEFLVASPGLSMIELAKRLNRGASALGLIMATYQEACQKGVVREAARDLLVREILEEYPEGWTSEKKIGAGIKLGSWRFEVKKYVKDQTIGTYATEIVRHLSVDHPPPDGWKPDPQDDPLINELFDRYWPIENSDAE